MKNYWTTLLLVTTAGGLGCNPSIDLGDLPPETEGGSGSATETGETEGTSTSNTTGPASASSSGTSGVNTDTAETTEGLPEGDVEKIDVLFVIDNSGSMGTVQGRLQQSASALAAVLESTGGRLPDRSDDHR